MPAVTKRHSQTKKPAPPTMEVVKSREDGGHLTDRQKQVFFSWDLPRTHELIIDAVASMLHSGGHADDVDALITAAIAHTRRRTYARGRANASENGEDIQAFINETFDDWKCDLITAWRKNQFPAPGAFTPSTITEAIRYDVRERVNLSFLCFMAGASSEEMELMLEVLGHRDSRNLPAMNGDDEIYLASAFEAVLGRDSNYLKVPEHMVDQVQKYIDALRAIEDKEVA